tara:strand:+ start:108 stop:971 length:864 start_codon:yes stop_codon:yes gene_type:complete
MKIIFYFLEFIFIKILFIFLTLLPLNLSKKISSLIFRTIGKLTSADKTATDNCKFIFPDLINIKVREIIDQSWNNIGITICELLKFKKLIKNNKIILNGLSNIESLKKNKKQAIFISIHQSNWEVLVPMIDRLGLRIGGIYRHINNYFLDRMILNIRNNTLLSNNNFYTPKGKKSAKDLLEAVNKGFSIVLLVDQKDSAGENIKLFNKKVKTQIGFLKIARKYNLPIIPIKNTRLDNGQIELYFNDPIFHNDDGVSDILMMEKIHRLIENWIISNPSQWFWQHKRFN